MREHMQGILGIDGLDTEIVFWAETTDPQTLMMTEQIVMTTADGDANMRFADSWVLRDGQDRDPFRRHGPAPGRDAGVGDGRRPLSGRITGGSDTWPR